MSSKDKSLTRQSDKSEIDAFLKDAKVLAAARQSGSGRLIFGMDATYSREPAWDMACQIQGEMFLATAVAGKLQVKLAYYGGFNTFKVSPWVNNAGRLLKLMSTVHCEGGRTQIARLLKYALADHRKQPIDALVFVGDCMEENADLLSDLAGQLGLAGVPVFIFQEGNDLVARKTFMHLCRLSKGAYCAFDAGSADQLKALLSAVAVYATAGQQAYLDYTKNKGIAGLLGQDVK